MSSIDEEADAEVAEELEDEEMQDVGEEEDEDAEGETDDEEGSEADAEAVEDDEDDEGEIVGAVKTRTTRSRRQRKVEESESEMDAVPAGSDPDDDDSSNAENENEWDAGDDAGEDIEVNNGAGSRCIFCGQDELNDPGEEYEEYLSCSVCGDNAHRQCARDADSLAADEDGNTWRCKECVANGLEADFKNIPDMLSSRRRTSAPKMARDLLPSARGGIKPDSHSVFNTLILDEDPMDGSRALRKRKSPSRDPDEAARAPIRKRRRTGETEEREEPPTIPEEDEGGEGAVSDAAASGSPKSRTGRPQRHTRPNKQGARILSRTDEPRSAILAIPITPAQWDSIEREVQKKQRRRERDRLRRARNSRRTATLEPEDNNHIPAFQTTMYNNPFYAFPDRETDETKGKPYGGILTEAEADTSRTYPQDVDRQAFQDARSKAEQQWKEKIAALNGETPARSKTAGPPSKIKCINFGQYEIDTWHAAPYPEEYSRNKHLYICEFCLKYMSSDYVAWRHKLKCSAKCPPGDEIYRSKVMNPETGAETTLSFFEVDGRRNPLYCQNLCLLAKLFLGSKTLYYDVEPFLFYIMTENDEFGCHFVGYFSKEKRGLGPLPAPNLAFGQGQDGQEERAHTTEHDSASVDPALSNPGNNVSCILVLPVHMRRGFGRVLIEFSYLLTKVEGRTGSPEKPLSDMGLVSYRSYWRTVLCEFLLRFKDQDNNANGEGPLSIAQIARETGMTPDDIISTLEALRALVRDPVTHRYALRLDYDYMKEYVEKHEKKATIKLDPEKLCWTPYVMGRPTNLFAMGEEANHPMQTVAPRDEPVEPPEDPADMAQPEIKVQEEHDIKDEDEIRVAVSPPNGVKGTTPEHNKASPPAPALTPQPSLEKGPISPARRSQAHTPNGTPGHTRSASEVSHQSGSQSTSAGPIPPTRFEIFPAVPGMASARKRGPGRPPRSSRRRSGHATPRRSGSSRRIRNSPGSATANTLRRGRSKLGDLPLNANTDDDDDKAEDDALDAAAEEDEDEDEDAPGEEDDEIKYD